MVMAALMLLAALLLPRLARVRHYPRINCLNQLQQIGIACSVWSSDYNDQYPMQVSTNQGGTKEYVGSPETYRHFQIMSNELGSPRVLYCPLDAERKFATNFMSDLNNSKVSYFVGVDATQTNYTMFVSGDRNVTNGTLATGGLLTLTTNRPAGWTGKMHVNCGNILLGDFSVAQLTTPGLRSALAATGLATNRLAMP